MASASRNTSQAEVSFLQSLKNCLVNLPASLVTALVNGNTVAQNVVVELTFRQPTTSGDKTAAKLSSVQKSIYVGWTGLQSKRKLAPVVGSEGLSGSRGISREQDISVVEIDATFARLVGLNEGQKIGVILHLDPPQAHTVNIEPLTPADWEMIELHAQFLELNFLSQIRALPNPSFTPSSGSQQQARHPLTLHLSPTTTANISVSSLTPAPSSSSPFVKISPDAEVIVAPKTRQKVERSSGKENRSVTSAGRRSAGGKSSTSTVRRRSGRDDGSGRAAVFLRGIDRKLGSDWFDVDEPTEDSGLRVWVDSEIVSMKAFRGVTWVSVSMVRPAGLRELVDPQKEQDAEKPPAKVVARIEKWDDPPDSRHAALSSELCKALGAQDLLGGLIRLEAAPPQLAATGKSQTDADKTVRIIPFVATDPQQSGGLRFGGESKQEREDTARRIKQLYRQADGKGLLNGPITDGMILPPDEEKDKSWQGGILKIGPAQTSGDNSQPIQWLLANEKKYNLDVQQGIPRPSSIFKSWSPGEPIPTRSPTMVGIDSFIEQIISHLSHSSSVLLTGGLGAGKTSLAYLLAHRLRQEFLFNTQYFPCRTLVTDETRVSTIKETLNRLFASASWGARQGGRSIVILDDIDRLCPVETELQVGGENGRSRHVSECICAIVREYCNRDSGIVLLATAQSKESVNNVIIGGHVVSEIVNVNAPNKEGRRRVLELLFHKDAKPSEISLPEANGTVSETSSQSNESTKNESRPSTSGQHGQQGPDGFVVDRTIDFLDLAGQTDGYMPGDLVLLVSRARSEALIRSVSDSSSDGPVHLTSEDFTSALEGFTPASLRNVTLQTSTTRWDSIGGLHSTRQVLLQTLQYPTTYAPIFAQSPLRLRSGILLYGYPGCGKTLLASAVAGECGLNFISVKGPEILNKYIGASEKSVRDLFERAESARPCVLFFDEFDSIAPKRGHDSTGVTDRVVNQLLTQMDGAEGLSGVYVLAATSRPDLIDPALLRPGRLDKSLICDLPGLEERIDILTAVTKKLRLSPSILSTGKEGHNLREIARQTQGYSGADLQAVAYNAQLEAIHDVLDDRISPDASRSKGNMSSTRPQSSSGKGIPDFTYFRVGDDLNAPAVPAGSLALTERGKIAANIAALQTLRRKQKQQQQAQVNRRSSLDVDNREDDEDQEKEPMIHWKHVDVALQNSRSSISAQERQRLAAIYKEFVVGRNGEMPNGQGGNEIGGRTSLM